MLLRAFASCGRLLGLGQVSPSVDEERRAWGRISCDVETTVKPCNVGCSANAEDRLTAQVRNVSRGGINLDLPRSFEPGALLSITLPGTAGEESSEVLVCVVHSSPAADRWRLGCTFATPLSDLDLIRFRSLPIAPPEADQRAWVRFPCAAQAIYSVVGSPDSAIHPAEVINISLNGIAIETKTLLPVGALISIELRRAGQPVCTTLASVVRTTIERNGDRIAGCNFIRELTEEQVQLLL
jgi:hypothetical protein